MIILKVAVKFKFRFVSPLGFRTYAGKKQVKDTKWSPKSTVSLVS